MWESVGDHVTVPSIVGLPFERARTIAAAAGVTLANTDPDGPPIGALAWEGTFFVSAQRPVGGTVVTRHSSVVVEITEDRPDDGSRVHSAPSPSPRSHTDRATADSHTGTQERNNALFTAGLVMMGLGAVTASFPNGLILGLVIALVGVSLTAAFATRVWRGRHRRPSTAAGEHPDPDRFWNAEERLKSAMIVSATFAVAAIGLSFLDPENQHWERVWIFGPLFLAATIAFVLVRRHNRARIRPDGMSEAVGRMNE